MERKFSKRFPRKFKRKSRSPKPKWDTLSSIGLFLGTWMFLVAMCHALQVEEKTISPLTLYVDATNQNSGVVLPRLSTILYYGALISILIFGWIPPADGAPPPPEEAGNLSSEHEAENSGILEQQEADKSGSVEQQEAEESEPVEKEMPENSFIHETVEKLGSILQEPDECDDEEEEEEEAEANKLILEDPDKEPLIMITWCR